MKTYRYFAEVTFSLFFAATLTGASVDENVTVYGEYLTDSDNYNYGIDYFLDSTVNGTVYVYPEVKSQENVYGSVTSGPILLQPNESHFRIGSFISSDHSKPWSVDVTAKWKRAD